MIFDDWARVMFVIVLICCRSYPIVNDDERQKTMGDQVVGEEHSNRVAVVLVVAMKSDEVTVADGATVVVVDD